MIPLLDGDMPLEWRVRQVYILRNGSKGTYADALHDVLLHLTEQRNEIEEAIKLTRTELRRAAQ